MALEKKVCDVRSSLPPDMWASVLVYVPARHVGRVCRLVCHAWRALVLSYRYLKNLDARHVAFLACLVKSEVLSLQTRHLDTASMFSKLQSLWYTGDALDEAEVGKALKQLPCLTCFQAPHHLFSGSAFEGISLSTLAVGGVTELARLHHVPTLRVLQLTPPVYQRDMQDLDLLHQLTELTLSNTTTDLDCLHYFINLRVLTLRFVRVCRLPGLSQLHTLHMHAVGNWPGLIQTIAKFTGLKTLSLVMHRGFDVEPFVSLTKLEEAKFEARDGGVVIGWRSLISRQLQSLDVVASTPETHEDCIFCWYNSLTKLCVDCEFNDTFWERADHLHHLRTARVPLRNLSHWSALHTLSVTKRTHNTPSQSDDWESESNAELKAISTLPVLRKLFYWFVSREGLVLLSQVRSLREFETSVEQLTAGEMAGFADFPILVSLDLFGVTERQLPGLLQFCRAETLSLKWGPRHVTASWLDQVAVLPGLNELHLPATLYNVSRAWKNTPSTLTILRDDLVGRVSHFHAS